MLVGPAKTAEPIEMRFGCGLWDWNPSDCVLNGGLGASMGREAAVLREIDTVYWDMPGGQLLDRHRYRDNLFHITLTVAELA